VEVRASTGYAGGGSLPEQALASVAVAISRDGLTAEALGARLRRARPPLVGRIERDVLLLDMLTVRDDEIDALVAAVTYN
jgi:L-seryl-tRNA(Ser) seleniumtransferase